MKKRLTLLLMSTVLVMSMAACGGKESSGGSEAASRDTGEQTEAADTEAVSDADTLVYAGEAESTINPLLNSHEELPDLIFSGLMKLDGEGKPVCDLAADYVYDADALTYTFTIRGNVTWHDGQAFTVDDVVYTYRLLMDDETLSASITSNYQDIEDVEAADEQTVVFHLSKPNAAMLYYFSMGILPRHLTEGEDINTMAFNQNPVGTGRYQFAGWDVTGGSIYLEANENYYGKVPDIKKIEYKTVSVESTKATMLMSGEADMAWLNANYAEQFRDNEAYTNFDFKTADYRGISMDFKTEFWQKNADSIGVLNEALDKQAIVDSVLGGRGIAAYSPIQCSLYGGNTGADIYPYDLAKFAKDMEALGWELGDDGIYERDGEKFHFTVQVRDYEEERVDIANLASAMFKKAGVDMEVVLVTKFDWEAGYNGFLAGYAAQFDPDQAYANFTTGGSSNSMQYSNEKVDADLNAGREAVSEEERAAAYSAFEEDYAQAPGIVLICYLDGNYVGVSGLEGPDTVRLLGHHAVGVMWNIEEWTLEK